MYLFVVCEQLAVDVHMTGDSNSSVAQRIVIACLHRLNTDRLLVSVDHFDWRVFIV